MRPSKTHQVQIKGVSTPILEGEFPERINEEESIWTLEPMVNNVRIVKLWIQKKEKSRWERAIKEGPKIEPLPDEVAEIEPLSDETRREVDKFDYSFGTYRTQGLPVVDERRKLEMLEKFMRAHPEMDFSNVKFN